MNPRYLLAVGVALLVVGCGGSDDEPTVEPAKDQSAGIARLERKKERLQREAARAKEAASEAGVSGLDSMLAALPGVAGVAVGSPGSAGPDFAAGEFSTGDAWSTIKVPIAERVLADAGGPKGLTSAQADEIDRAITLSDNDAAAALFEDLERAHGGLGGASEAVGEMLRQAGDTATVVSTTGRDGFSTYGQTDWSLSDQFRYMAALAGGCVGDPASREYLASEMSSVGGSDTFGLGSTGVPARWKGGWGPGTDGRYLVRQMGVAEADGKRMVVTMAAIPDDGTFETGQSMLDDIAGWTTTHLAGRVSAPTSC